MADTAISTGAKHDSDLRRRNVPDTARPQAPVPYTAEDVKKQKPQSTSFLQVLASWEPILAPIILTALALFTRLYRIGRSNIVTWDEAQ
ncbi:Glycosyl transferase family 39 [Penicillium longicatenatum]|nr:Glycosyl transferase family 39 [Penicillium longicatenatum]